MMPARHTNQPLGACARSFHQARPERVRECRPAYRRRSTPGGASFGRSGRTWPHARSRWNSPVISLFFSAIALLSITATAFAQPALDEQPGQAIATAYGIGGWDEIERIDFTFNVQRPGDPEPAVVRAWSWWPKTTAVRLEREGEEPIEYRRDALPRMRLPSDHPIIQADRQFINDSYWFLFPFQIVWSNPTVIYEGEVSLPINESEAQKVTVQYPDEGGYTPGDAYDLYVDEGNRIEAWVFRRGGKAEGNAMTWEQHRRLGPIIVSLEHWGEANEQGERFHLWFTDVRAELVDEEESVMPQPMGDRE